MKKRSFVAKAVSAVVLASTVSGYALAGDHSISVDPSWTWCKLMPETEASSGIYTAAGAIPYIGSNSGSCTSADVNVKFSGKVGGWSYYADIDPSSGADDGLATDMRGSVKISKGLGNGLTFSVGDTGNGSRSDSWSGHSEWQVHDGDSVGKGGVRLDYSAGAINASFVYGGVSPATDNQASSINVGADMTFSGINVGGSYHSYTGGQEADASTKKSEMMFHVKGTFGGYVVSGGYDMVTNSDTNKTNHMGLHVWGTKGDIRPEIHYVTNSENTEAAVSGANHGDTKLAIGAKYSPAAWGGTNVSVQYHKITNADEAVAPTTTYGNTGMIKVGISTSVNVL